MAINFIRNLIDGNIDNDAHSKFIRYGKGNYEKEELKIKVTGKNVTIQAGPDFVSVLLKLFAEFSTEEITLSGKMVAKKGQNKRFEDAGVKLIATRATTYTVEKTFSPEEFKTFIKDFEDFLFLVTLKSGSNTFKAKPKVPRPGSVLEKFVTVKWDKQFIDRIKEEFLPDFPDFKKEAVFKHWYNINDIIADEQLLQEDPLKARLAAKRKGTLKRKSVVDGLEKEEEFAFEA